MGQSTRVSSSCPSRRAPASAGRRTGLAGRVVEAHAWGEAPCEAQCAQATYHATLSRCRCPSRWTRMAAPGRYSSAGQRARALAGRSRCSPATCRPAAAPRPAPPLPPWSTEAFAKDDWLCGRRAKHCTGLSCALPSRAKEPTACLPCIPSFACLGLRHGCTGTAPSWHTNARTRVRVAKKERREKSMEENGTR